MRTPILAIGYSFDEYKAIQESFHTVDKDLELQYAESVDAARQMLYCKKYVSIIFHVRALDSLPFVNLLRSIADIPVLQLSPHQVHIIAPRFITFQCAELKLLKLTQNLNNCNVLKAPFTIIRAGDLEFCAERRRIAVAGQQLSLTQKEYDILSLLISNQRRVLTYEMIIDVVWQQNLNFYSRRVVNNHISNLKKKIRAASSRYEYIVSVRGVGYKFEV